MTDGLAILGAWLELGAVLVGVAWMLLRRAEGDPMDEARRESARHQPNG